MNKYEKNDTMKLISHQPLKIFTKEVSDGIQEIAEAVPDSFSMDSAMDIFTFGYISGVRAERKKRKLRLIPKKALDIVPPTMEKDISDIISSFPCDAETAVKLYITGYVRGKQDLLRIFQSEQQGGVTNG